MTTDVIARKKVKLKLKDPKKYAVIIHNDDVTTMEFVMAVLIQVFGHNFEDAKDIVLNVHEKGEGSAGIFSYEVAEALALEGKTLARANNFPLKFSVREE